jgi:hypothetical protein
VPLSKHWNRDPRQPLSALSRQTALDALTMTTLVPTE